MEMEEKGLTSAVADRIGEYVKLNGGPEILDTLKSNLQLRENEDVKKGLDDIDLLFRYLDALDVTDKISFDLSLARGLDYYSSLIFEVVTSFSTAAGFHGPQGKSHSKSKVGEDNDEDRSDDPSLGMGSIAAGGRYDNLVNMFSKKRQIPCIGVSFGVDRIFTLMKTREEQKQGNSTRPSEVDVYIMAFGGKTFNGLLLERMSVANQLWKAGIKAEFAAKVKPKLPQQFKSAESGRIPLAVILGEDELAAGKVRLKALGLLEGHPEKEGLLIAREDLVSEVKKLLR
jgi:histidyl-tRNA synthetase